MATLQAEIDKLVAEFGERGVMQMAETIRAYMTAAPAEPGNLEKLSAKLADLAKRRETRHAANMANDNRPADDPRLKQMDVMLREAMQTLRQMPMTGGMRGGGSAWPEMLQEWAAYGSVSAEPPRLTPSTRDIALMDRLIGLVLSIGDADIRKVLMLHPAGNSFRKIAKEMGVSDKTVAARYREGLAMLVEKYF